MQSAHVHHGSLGWGPSATVEQLTDPIAGRGSCDRLAVRIDVGRTCAVFKQQGDDPALLLLCSVRARIALSGVLDGQVQGGGSALVHQTRIRTVCDEGADRARTTVPNGPVHWGHAASVHSVWMCTCFDEASDYLTLRISAPVARSGSPICGVVNRLGTPSIASPNICALPDERLGER